MKKTLYRISLYNRETIANDLATFAAAFNGGHSQFTLPALKGIVESNKTIYPSLYGDLSAEISNDTKLTISRTEKEKTTVLIEIQEVEVWEGNIDPPTLERHQEQ